MDFGIGFLTNNIMLPILDFFYGIVPSYGLAIVALTLVIRLALYPLNAGSIRNMRRMKVTQPLMQKRVKEIQDRHKDDPAKLQEEMSKVYKEFGNPLAGCFPVLVQMPILFALFATLRGSPFSDIPYDVNFQVFPEEKIEQIQPQIFSTPPKAIYVSDGAHFPIAAVVPGGNKLVVGEKTDVRLQTAEGKAIDTLVGEYSPADVEVEDFQPKWLVTKGEDVITVDQAGNVTALAPGEATVKVQVPGLATNKGFLFIKALGRVGVTGEDGAIHWDILLMVLSFGASLYLNQVLSGQGASSDNPQQNAVNKFTPIIFSGMFLFFPLPAGVLMYMLIANIFQTFQTFILSREPLPENLQKIVDAEASKTAKSAKGAKGVKGEDDRQTLPFEPGGAKKKKA
ncbi:MAG: membrane protein insertase YidC [Nodosilinea sp.]